MSYSQALTHLTLWLQRRKANDKSVRTPPATIPRVPQDEFVQNMLRIAQLSAAHGAQPILIAPVYRDATTDPPEAARIRAHRDALRAAAQSANIPFLEIPELYETNYPATQQLFGELIHPNHEGHRVMANALLRFFATHDTLKGFNVPPSL
jgi:lysophospholipase L1-like esterase